MNDKTIQVNYLARVEGEGSLWIRIEEGKVVDAKLKIFEPPRFFEAFLRGRDFTEVPDITARICGICPVAYQMSSVHAIEQALGITIDGQLRELRRLLYCGEWIESHTLHIFMLHAPDFLGYPDAIQMARDHRSLVENGLTLKKTGNEIVELLGGRAVHPVNVKVGGFYRLPTVREFRQLRQKLLHARQLAQETVTWAGSLTFPDFEQDYELVSLFHPTEYPFNEGRLISNKGLDISVSEYEDHFEESQVEHSTALHSKLKARGSYFTGPLARFVLCHEQLPESIRLLAAQAGLTPDCRNPFKSIIARSVEVLYACEEAIRIIDRYEMPEQSARDVVPRKSNGCACTEAPRGILYHRFEIDIDGRVVEARIVPPTSQNQSTIETDLRAFTSTRGHLGDEDLTWQCEQAVRNYDPCISCSTHFLKVQIERE